MTFSSRRLADRAAITEVVQQYIDAATSGSGNDMRRSFHEDATIFGYLGEDLLAYFGSR